MDEKLFSARMAEYKSAVDKYLDACLRKRSAQAITS